MAQLLAVPAETITPGKMTCDLRRLRMHGLIERVPGTFRYQVTDTGMARALFLARLGRRETNLISIDEQLAPCADAHREVIAHP